MKTNIEITKEVEVKTLLLDVGVRYFEDAKINGIEDTEGTLTPCVINGRWCPEIDIEKGTILNWNKGVFADIHFKVCDDGNYYLKDSKGEIVLKIESDYVPKILDLYNYSYGDYIILTIDENGVIEDWNNEPSLEGFKYE